MQCRTRKAGLWDHGQVVKRARTEKLVRHEKGVWWRDAREKLALSYRPDALVGRETERQQLRSSFDELLHTGQGGAIYVSGLAGTGKTLTVGRVLAELGPRARGLMLNCGTISEPKHVYRRILEEIDGRPRAQDVSRDDLLARLRDIRAPLIIVLDELDFLITRDQMVLYSLFELPRAHTGAPVIMAAIANAIDLPDRLLPLLQSARCVPKLVPFRPYDSTCLERILLQRVPPGAIDTPAVRLCAKRVASCCGDARMALDVCSAAIFSARSQPARPPTLIASVAKILDATGGNGRAVSTIEALPTQQQMILCSLVRRAQKQVDGQVGFGELYDEYRSLCTRTSTSALTYAQFVDACSASLVENGLLEITAAKAAGKRGTRRQQACGSSIAPNRLRKVRLRAGVKDVVRTLESKRLFAELLA